MFAPSYHTGLICHKHQISNNISSLVRATWVAYFSSYVMNEVTSKQLLFLATNLQTKHFSSSNKIWMQLRKKTPLVCFLNFRLRSFVRCSLVRLFYQNCVLTRRITNNTNGNGWNYIANYCTTFDTWICMKMKIEILIQTVIERPIIIRNKTKWKAKVKMYGGKTERAKISCPTLRILIRSYYINWATLSFAFFFNERNRMKNQWEIIEIHNTLRWSRKGLVAVILLLPSFR